MSLYDATSDWCTEVLLTNKRATALNLQIPNAANLKAGSYILEYCS